MFRTPPRQPTDQQVQGAYRRIAAANLRAREKGKTPRHRKKDLDIMVRFFLDVARRTALAAARGGRPGPDPEDVAQDVTLSLLRKLTNGDNLLRSATGQAEASGCRPP